MLSPHATVRGPLPKHTPVLVEALRDAGCHVQSEPWGRHSDDESLMGRIWSRARDIRHIRVLVRNSDLDVMVVKTSHDWVSLLRDLPLLLVTRRSAPHIVFQFHGGRSDMLVAPKAWLFKAASWVLFKLADGVLVLSAEEARYAAEFHPSGKFYTVVNPLVSPSMTLPERPGAESSSQVPTILFASRLIEEKGVCDLLEAFARVRAQRTCRLVVAGTGPAEERLSCRAKELRLSADVSFLGHVPADELLVVYRDADVFVLPTYWPEGFPTAITEAMAAGLPVVTTRLRGMADHLVERENALFVAPKAPHELADAIQRLLDDDTLRARMSTANRARVNDFAPPAAATRYLDALRKITGTSHEA